MYYIVSVYNLYDYNEIFSYEFENDAASNRLVESDASRYSKEDMQFIVIIILSNLSPDTHDE